MAHNADFFILQPYQFKHGTVQLINVLGESTDETWGERLFGTENEYMMPYDLSNCSIISEFHDGDYVAPAMINIFPNNQNDPMHYDEYEKCFTISRINSYENFVVIYDKDSDCLITQGVNGEIMAFNIAEEGYVIGGYELNQAWKTIKRVEDESGNTLLKLEIGSVIDRWITNPNRAYTSVVEMYIQFDGDKFTVVDEQSYVLEIDRNGNAWHNDILLNKIPIEKIDDFSKYTTLMKLQPIF